jgi:tRNA dimethylallyltransferase
MIKVLVIVGPTGTHKSDLAKMLAKKFNGAIINADAFQVYQEIKIGTGQTPPADGINFYLNGTVSIFEE